MKRERVNSILRNERYRKYVKLNEKAEKNREFCHHDMAHFLDVARLAVILNMTENQQVENEFIYAAALLHDIGRHVQYADGTPHEKASAVLAPEILEECGFGEAESEEIIKAILSHRDKEAAGRAGLEGLLYRADKMSRSCFFCKAEEKCSWKGDKKNRELRW